MTTLLSNETLTKTLRITDLTNPLQQPHAMQVLLSEIRLALKQHWSCPQQLVRTSPVVSIQNNYDRLGYPDNGAAREERYTRYVSPDYILRTQTSSAIPDLLDGLSMDPPQELLLLLPGLVYRRDSIDRLHCGEPHQLDLWRIHAGDANSKLAVDDLLGMVELVIQAAVPGHPWRTIASPHPYTEQGVQIDVQWQDEWIEVGECGLIARDILRNAGLTNYSGLAMGLGLDRLLMIRKGIPDIRLLRSENPRVKAQMKDLQPYVAVSAMPAIRRDLSICMDKNTDVEIIGDMIRESIEESACIESVEVQSETPYEALPSAAHRRMGMLESQKNILLQLTIRHMEKTLTDEAANCIRNQVYQLLHEGEQQELANNKTL